MCWQIYGNKQLAFSSLYQLISYNFFTSFSLLKLRFIANAQKTWSYATAQNSSILPIRIIQKQMRMLFLTANTYEFVICVACSSRHMTESVRSSLNKLTSFRQNYEEEIGRIMIVSTRSYFIRSFSYNFQKNLYMQHFDQRQCDWMPLEGVQFLLIVFIFHKWR